MILLLYPITSAISSIFHALTNVEIYAHRSEKTNISCIDNMTLFQELIRSVFCEISGFFCIVVEVFTFVGFYAAYVGASQPVLYEDPEE